MTALPYPIPSSVIEPGDNDPATRLIGRLTAGTAFARAKGYKNITVCLTRADFALYAEANEGLPNALPLDQSIYDGAKVSQQLEGQMSYFSGFDFGGKAITFPLMTDGQYVAAVTLVPGMFVVREGDLTPRELVRDPLTPGILRVGLHRYDAKGRAVKHKAPVILYAWHKDVMEAKAEAGLLTDIEKALFSSLFSYQMTYLESLTSVHQ